MWIMQASHFHSGNWIWDYWSLVWWARRVPCFNSVGAARSMGHRTFFYILFFSYFYLFYFFFMQLIDLTHTAGLVPSLSANRRPSISCPDRDAFPVIWISLSWYWSIGYITVSHSLPHSISLSSFLFFRPLPMATRLSASIVFFLPIKLHRFFF